MNITGNLKGGIRKASEKSMRYLKHFVLLLVTNVLLASMLCMTRGSSIYAQKQTNYEEQIQTQEVTIQTQPRVSMQRTVPCKVLVPQYVIRVSEQDIDTLMRIVEAEAGGEDRKGKLLVANVIINRVKAEEFPDTVTEVVYQKVKNVTQFSPVSDGKIRTVKVSEETREVVYSALLGEDVSDGALYFVARKIADAEKVCWFDENLTFLFSYGGHDFFL